MYWKRCSTATSRMPGNPPGGCCGLSGSFMRISAPPAASICAVQVVPDRGMPVTRIGALIVVTASRPARRVGRRVGADGCDRSIPLSYTDTVKMARNLIAGTRPTSAHGEMQRVARGGAFALVGVAVSAVLQFALVLVVTHGLPRATAGAFLEAVALFMILSNWTELGADTGVVRMVPRLRATGREGDLRALVRAAVVPVALAGAAAALFMLVLAGPASHVLFGSQAQSGKTFLVVLAPALPFACVLTVLLAVTRGFGRMRP